MAILMLLDDVVQPSFEITVSNKWMIGILIVTSPRVSTSHFTFEVWVSVFHPEP